MNEKVVFNDNLCLMKTNKYKTIQLFLYYTGKYSIKKKVALNILTTIIGDYSIKYDTKEKMVKAKDYLYDADINCNIKLRANLMTFTVKYSFINPKFLSDVSIYDYLDFFKECLNNPYFSEKLLCEFKRNYKDAILRSLDKPSKLASNRVNQIIACNDSAFKIYDCDDSAVIDEIDLEYIKQVYSEVINSFDLNIYLCGDYDNTLLEYVGSFKNDYCLYLKNEPIHIGDLGEIIEKKNVSQSTLNVVYKTPYNRKHKDFYAYMLGNVLLGNVPTSLLFEEVREKLSLCYYIGVTDYKNEGLVKIVTSINGENKDEVIKQIDIQIKRLIDMDYDFVKIDLARALLIDSLKSTPDNLDSYVDYLFYNKLNGVECSLNEYIDNINKVTAKEISEVFKNYKHVLTYMLKGIKDE